MFNMLALTEMFYLMKTFTQWIEEAEQGWGCISFTDLLLKAIVKLCA